MCMKKLLILLFTFIFFCVNFAIANMQHPASTNSKETLSPDQILKKLKLGNQRYMNGEPAQYGHGDFKQLINSTNLSPKAFVFNCVDSRTSPEVIFDQPAGAIFVSTIAGDVVGTDVLGSMDLAVKNSGSKLIVVMGHTQCRTVMRACTGVKSPKNLNNLLINIKPAVQKYAKHRNKSVDCNRKSDINGIARQNIVDQLHNIMKLDKSLAKKINNKEVILVGAMHDMASGEVVFFDINGQPI